MKHALPDCPDFNSFYRTVNDRDPFPWQSRLAERVREGDWPDLIGVPTGLGKTSCVDIAVWALAVQADRPPGERTAPTRLWWVVNRRLLVDDTYEHARRLAKRLEEATGADHPLASVATRLYSLSCGDEDPNTGTSPLEVVRLRGGVNADRPWNPAQPAIICSTIPMYGSRVLFRGYGSSRSTRPIDAALAYTDSLVICDEAHLATHLVDLFAQLADVDRGARGPILPGGRHRPRVVAVTATGDPGGDRFDLTEEDHENDEIRKRLCTRKPVRIVSVSSPTAKPERIAQHLAKEVESLLAERPPASCLVFVNSPATARAVERQLAGKASRRTLAHPRVVMLTGRMREYEAAVAREAVLDRRTGIRAGQPQEERRRHLIVVATQTLEVGADLDAEFMVTEACGVRALTQRLGRFNRLGTHPQPRGVYVHIPPAKGDAPRWAVYGEEPTTVFARLRDADPEGSGVIDLSPAKLYDGLLGPPCDEPKRAPRVSVALLREWAQSTWETPGEAPVEPFFSGLEPPFRDVQIVWRAYLPDPGQRVWPTATDQEAITVPIWEAQDGLVGAAEDMRRVLPDGPTEEIRPDDDSKPVLRPGWTVILRSSVGKMDKHGWNPEATAPVPDRSIVSDGIPLNPETFQAIYPGENLVDRDTVRVAAGDGEDGEPVAANEQREACEQVIQVLADRTPAGYYSAEWATMIADLDPTPRSGRGEVSRLQRRTRRGRSVRSDVFDELSADSNTTVDLEQHGAETATFAASYANALGIDSNRIVIVEKGAELHDIGKADPRFQEWLRGNRAEDEKLLAKSTTSRRLWEQHRIRAGWPKGGRHEVLSGRLVLAWLESHPTLFDTDKADLLVHLVLAHHGRGRPLLLPVSDKTGSHRVTVSLEGDTVTVEADLSVVDWEQPRRFAHLNRLHGYWGLALLETIVRQADWVASGSRLEVR